MKLEALGVSKSFGGGDTLRQVIADLTLKVEFPNVLTLLGPSGGGKSTLLRLVAGLELPDAGSLILDEVVVPREEAPLRAYRRSLGVVFQSFNLFPHMSAFQNVLLPLTAVHGLDKDSGSDRAAEVMRRLGLADHGDKLPSQLSGGQRQRVAIARAMAIRPRFLLFDEPTSALDPEMTAEVLSLIAELRESGTPMLLVTHEMAFARRISDQVAYLANGKVLECTSSGNFFARPTTEQAQRFLEKVLSY